MVANFWDLSLDVPNLSMKSLGIFYFNFLDVQCATVLLHL